MVEGASFPGREIFRQEEGGGNEFLTRRLPCGAAEGVLRDRLASDLSSSAQRGPNGTDGGGRKHGVALPPIEFLRAVRVRYSSVSAEMVGTNKALDRCLQPAGSAGT